MFFSFKGTVRRSECDQKEKKKRKIKFHKMQRNTEGSFLILNKYTNRHLQTYKNCWYLLSVIYCFASA